MLSSLRGGVSPLYGTSQRAHFANCMVLCLLLFVLAQTPCTSGASNEKKVCIFHFLIPEQSSSGQIVVRWWTFSCNISSKMPCTDELWHTEQQKKDLFCCLLGVKSADAIISRLQSSSAFKSVYITTTLICWQMRGTPAWPCQLPRRIWWEPKHNSRDLLSTDRRLEGPQSPAATAGPAWATDV